MDDPSTLCSENKKHTYLKSRKISGTSSNLIMVITQNHQTQTEFVWDQHGSTGSDWVESVKPPLGSAGRVLHLVNDVHHHAFPLLIGGGGWSCNLPEGHVVRRKAPSQSKLLAGHPFAELFSTC